MLKNFKISSHLGDIDIQYAALEPIVVPFRPTPPYWQMQAAAAGWRPPDPVRQFEIDYSFIVRTSWDT